MKKTGCLLIGLLMAMMWGCAEDGLFIGDDSLPIRFAYQIFTTRADTTESDDTGFIYNEIPADDCFAVYARHYDGDDYFSDLLVNGTGKTVDGREVTWPGRHAKLVFTAIFPARLTGLYDEKRGMIYDCKTGSFDLLTAQDTIENNGDDQGIAFLKFYHALADLSRISIERVSPDAEFRPEEENYELELHKVSIELRTTGNLEVATGEWSELTDSVAYEIIPKDGPAKLELNEMFSDWEESRKDTEFFIPQDVTFRVWISLYKKEGEVRELIFGEGEEGSPLYAVISGFKTGSRIHLSLQLSVKTILEKLSSDG